MNRIDVEGLDLNLFKVFEALYEEGGAGRAAIRLGVTQSAVSASLARLRAVYGDHLFERTGRGLRPTAKSEELRPVIAAALDKCRQSLQLISDQDGTFSGRTLSIGLSDDYEIAIGRRLIDLAKRLTPGLRLTFKQTHSLVCADALMSRNIDVALTAGTSASRVLGRKVLASGGYTCLTGVGQGAASEPLTLDEYLQRRHVLVSSGGYVGVVDEALAARSLSRVIEAATTHFASLPHLLHGSDCVATLPTHAAIALANIAPVQCRPCPIELPRYSVELGWRVEGARDPLIQKMLVMIEQVIDELPGSDFSLA
ncbi:LysR family transcriptional regulator [Pseudomonas sp. NPDC090755]|uniref:LysR family transcriptional regulator n=1 Tax=Pseudomonas sp. NPDC090755 TaxID=3364481 RepID=UPI00383B4A7A